MYQSTQVITLPPDAAHDEVSGTVLDDSVPTPATGKHYAMWQSLLDVNGDGRPDLIYQKNNQLWVAYNQPGANGTTTIGAGQAVGPLSDATFATGPLATNTATELRFHYAQAKSNVVYVWREVLDVNGDGRLDVIDASEQADHWVVYLNTRGSQGQVKWERRSYDVSTLRATLNSFGHIVPSNFVPLSQRVTGTNLKIWECWKWSGSKWEWYSDGFANHRCAGVDGGVNAGDVVRGPERTFIQWELKDVNGDGYPDVVLNSTPVTYQLTAPPQCQNIPHPNAGEVCPGAAGVRVTVPFAPGVHNAIRAMFNVRGVRFYSDDNPFSRSFDLMAPRADQGLDQWACANILPDVDFECPDESKQSQYASLVDVNGDGLADRVVGNKAFLGLYAGTAVSFADVYLSLPALLATQTNTHATACAPNSSQEGQAEQIQGLKDLTGDGIPDFLDVAAHRVWIGTGVGFFHSVPIVVNGADLRLSHETELCDGRASKTDGGLYDLDGDGRPDLVGLDGNTLRVAELVGGSATGAPEAGRLTQIDNGYGAITHIDYISAKHFTDNILPFPEIVVAAVGVTGSYNLGGTLEATRYAYGNAELEFDSVQDAFGFTGYHRTVELHLTPATHPIAGKPSPQYLGAALISDTWPLTPFTPGLTQAERWLRTERNGRLSDVWSLQASATLDPWSLLDVDGNDLRIMGRTHFDWAAQLFEAPSNLSAGLANCIEMVYPLDWQHSLANAANEVDICRTHGFAYRTVKESWRGSAPPPSSSNVQVRSEVLAVDSFGRTTLERFDNDIFRDDDDYCIATRYAVPNSLTAPIRTAVASRQMIDCNKRNAYAGESFEYDHLPGGLVSRGLLTAHTIDRRDTLNGAPLGSIRRFDADYDALGNIAVVRSSRDAATRSVSFSYDPFGLAIVATRVDASGISPSVQTVNLDPVSLEHRERVDAHQVRHGSEFDGFGRWVRSTLTVPGGMPGVTASAEYAGYTTPDAQGRRLLLTEYMDAVPATELATTPGRRATSFLDELGRIRRTELELGSDYGGDALVIGARSFDTAGRVIFAADTYPRSESAAIHYGRTTYYNTRGAHDCVIQGAGLQPYTTVTDQLHEIYPTCFNVSYADHLMTADRSDPSALQNNSPQAGVVHRTVTSAIGSPLVEETVKANIVLEYSAFNHDRLHQLTGMQRYLDPVTQLQPVAWSWHLDSLGQLLELSEPESAVKAFDYSDWGELTAAHWVDGAVDRRLVQHFDAASRLTASEERRDAQVEAATVRTFSYDLPAVLMPSVHPTFVEGRLAQATAASGRTAFSYDALGRITAEVFQDDGAVNYLSRFSWHDSGPLGGLTFNLPDDGYADEAIQYEFDSASRLRQVRSADASGPAALFKADVIDPIGHVRKATYGDNTLLTVDFANQGRRLLRNVEVKSSLGSRRIEYASFDSMGRETARREWIDGVAVGAATYSQYGKLGELTRVKRLGAPTLSWQFDYDALGNLLELRDLAGPRDATMSLRADDRDRICRIEYAELLSSTECNVGHDGLGNVTSEPARNDTRQMVYSPLGSLQTLTEGTAQATFSYDAFGALAKIDVQHEPGHAERHNRRLGPLFERIDAVTDAGSTSHLLRRIPGPQGVIASRSGADQTWNYEFAERRGKRAFFDQHGKFVQDLTYQPYGEATSLGAPVDAAAYHTEQWNGGTLLPEFAVVSLGARLYDPAIGRFLSRDPLLSAPGATASNPYAFAQNNPVNATDPSGLGCNGVGCIQSGSGDDGADSSGVVVVVDPGPTLGALGSVFFGGGRSEAPAPAVSSGPIRPAGAQTQEGYTRYLMTTAWLGDYAPPGFNYDAAARSGQTAAGTLDIIISMGSLKRDAEIDRDNARLDYWSDVARIAGGGLAAGALVVAGGFALVGADIVFGAGSTATVATFAAPAVPVAVVAAEDYEPELDNALAGLYEESGIPATISYDVPAESAGQQVYHDWRLMNGEADNYAETFAEDVSRLTQRPIMSGWPVTPDPALAERTMVGDIGFIFYNYSQHLHHVSIRGFAWDP